MIPRFQPPVATPVDLRTLAAGLGAMLTGAAASRLRAEQILSAMAGARAAIPTDSGTSALTLAMLAAKMRRAGPIALPAYGCFDLATAVVGANASAVFYDLDPGTLQPDRASLVRALAVSPSAVVVVHLFGVPVDTDPIAALLAGNNLLIDDAAQGVGAALRGRPLGAAGAFGILSLGRGKGMAGGGGGGLFANAEDAVSLLESVRPRLGPARLGVLPWGALVAQWVLGRPSLYALAAAIPCLHLGKTRYRAPVAPRSMAASASGVLASAAARTEADGTVRRRNAELLDEAAASCRAGVVRVLPVEGAVPGYLRYPVLSAALANRARESVAVRRLGVQPGYPSPLPQLPALAGRVVNPADQFPGAERLVEELVTLPTHRFLGHRDLRRLMELLREVPRSTLGVGLRARQPAAS